MHRHMLIGAAASLALSGATAVAAEFSARYSGFQELGALTMKRALFYPMARALFFWTSTRALAPLVSS
jgi:hypothetical protein